MNLNTSSLEKLIIKIIKNKKLLKKIQIKILTM